MPARPLPALALVLPAILLLACTSSTLAAESAEPTHCPADQLTIDEARQPLDGPSSWAATCGADGQRWFCSRMHQRVICTEDPTPQTADNHE